MIRGLCRKTSRLSKMARMKTTFPPAAEGAADKKLKKGTQLKENKGKQEEIGKSAKGSSKTTHPTLPKRDTKGHLIFPDHPDFRPNLSPEEIIQSGSFGGTYFRPIYSSVTKQQHKGEWKEFEQHGWFKGVDVSKMVTSSTYRIDVNKYKAKCGQTLEYWQEHGWIVAQDPYGWFQWYCRFYLGRRTPHDKRQIARWKAICGLTGRWRNNLIAKCVRAHRPYDDVSVSPAVRQTLQHWGYRLDSVDFEAYAKKVRAGAKTAFISEPVALSQSNAEEKEAANKRAADAAQARGDRAKRGRGD